MQVYLTSSLVLDIRVVSFLSVINSADMNSLNIQYFPEPIRERILHII